MRFGLVSQARMIHSSRDRPASSKKWWEILGVVLTASACDPDTSQVIESIAVGGGYSIALDATPAHPFLAEYEQEVRIYGGEPREGRLLGRVSLPMNSGGRIRIGVLIPDEPWSPTVVLADRHETTAIQLPEQIVASLPTWRDPGLRPLGLISAESSPVKFIPCSAWPFLSVEEQQTIIREGDGLTGFCELGASSASPTRE